MLRTLDARSGGASGGAPTRPGRGMRCSAHARAVVPARPSAISYDDATALIVVDVQNDFADPSGGLYVSGGEDVVVPRRTPRSMRPSPPALRLLHAGLAPAAHPALPRTAGSGPCTASPTPGVRSCIRACGGRARRAQGRRRRGRLLGLHDARPDLGRAQFGTGLEDAVRSAGASRLVVLGLAGDVCVKATALDGVNLGWETTVPWAAVRSVELNPGDDAAAQDELTAAGVRILPERCASPPPRAAAERATTQRRSARWMISCWLRNDRGPPRSRRSPAAEPALHRQREIHTAG